MIQHGVMSGWDKHTSPGLGLWPFRRSASHNDKYHKSMYMNTTACTDTFVLYINGAAYYFERPKKKKKPKPKKEFPTNANICR